MLHAYQWSVWLDPYSIIVVVCVCVCYYEPVDYYDLHANRGKAGIVFSNVCLSVCLSMHKLKNTDPKKI